MQCETRGVLHKKKNMHLLLVDDEYKDNGIEQPSDYPPSFELAHPSLFMAKTTRHNRRVYWKGRERCNCSSGVFVKVGRKWRGGVACVFYWISLILTSSG